MGREFELKFRATAEQLEDIGAQYAPFTQIRMETTYYDAPSGVLSRLHWTFRRRMENGVSVVTLKSDLPDGSRGEWETECGDILAAVPALLALGAPAELAEYTSEGVVPTCGARFLRRAAKISLGNAVAELALDQGVLLGGGKEEPISEVEVELKEGPDGAVIAFGAELARKYGLQPESRSKIKRALALAGRA